MAVATYVGETGRTLELRLKEHQRAVKSRQTSNGIAVHANSTQHSIATMGQRRSHLPRDTLAQEEGTGGTVDQKDRQHHEPGSRAADQPPHLEHIIMTLIYIINHISSSLSPISI